MATRRNALKFGMIGGAVALTAPTAGAALAATPASRLAPANMPVPYAATFRRPPELVPYSTGRDSDGRPFAKYSLSQRLGQAQIARGLFTTIAGYNGTFPGPTIRVPQGTRTEV